MSKKVTDIQKKEILNNFKSGISIKDLALKYSFSIQTITRQLKKQIGDKEFKLYKASRVKNQIKENSIVSFQDDSKINDSVKQKNLVNNNTGLINDNDFVEIAPLREIINLEHQTDLTSKPLKNIKFPNVVFIIVDKDTELQKKMLRDYPEWSFLSSLDLDRYSIQIFSDQKAAKLKCLKNHKIIKVPNPNIFFIASNILKSKGISRIIFEDSLFSI